MICKINCIKEVFVSIKEKINFSGLLVKAMKKNNIEEIRDALENGADPDSFISGKENLNVTVLMSACEDGNMETAEILVEYGASIHAKSIFGNTALMFAAGSGNEGLMRYLVSKGANIRDTDNYGYSVLLMAAGSGSIDCLKFCDECGLSFIEKGYHDLTPLMTAGSLEAVIYIMEKHDVNVNAESLNGGTALIYAAGRNDYNIAKYLVEHGAMLNARERDVDGSFGKTALHYAAERGNLMLVQYLIEHGADICIKSKYGETALDFAVAENHTEIVEYLVNTDTGNPENNFETALINAAGRGTAGTPMVTYLIEVKKTPVDCTGKNGTTPLMKAAEAESPELVEYLISHGATPAMTDENGRSAIDYVKKEPPVEYENAHDAWCYSNAGDVLIILEKYINISSV